MKSRAMRRKLRRMKIYKLGAPKDGECFVLRYPRGMPPSNLMRICKVLGEFFPGNNAKVIILHPGMSIVKERVD